MQTSLQRLTGLTLGWGEFFFYANIVSPYLGEADFSRGQYGEAGRPQPLFICTYPHCTKTFKRYGDLKRHFKKHFPVMRTFECFHQECDRNGTRGFYRKDKFEEHRRVKHGL
jgi:hypothetical protein